MKEGPEKHVCAWSPLPSQITVDRKATGRATQTCYRADGQTLLTLLKEEVTVVSATMVARCVCTCESLMKVNPPVDLPSLTIYY